MKQTFCYKQSRNGHSRAKAITTHSSDIPQKWQKWTVSVGRKGFNMKSTLKRTNHLKKTGLKVWKLEVLLVGKEFDDEIEMAL